MLDVHLDRISDLALEACEPDDLGEGTTPWRHIELENVSFTYGMGLPPVLRNVSLRVEAGRTTAIVGPSGSGKTTLFKILCGLLQPTSGRVLVDGLPIQEVGVRRYRDGLGVVSQEDVLFAGSIADNVAFFDPDYDMKKIQDACTRAGVDDDIVRMPMKYDTMVGDMGSSLSGGQRQRVLLARALYKEPKFLMLDEGTSHLDVATEARVVNMVKQLESGRLLVAHRPETIRAADVVYELRAGALVLRGPPQPSPGPPIQIMLRPTPAAPNPQ
jgi:ATP-binding cassette subfamily B protein RaxB